MPPRTDTTLTHVLDAAGALKRLILPELVLEVTAGPDRGLTKNLQGERLTLGAALGNGLVLTDPTVSAYHCELKLTGEGLRLRDLGSKNGVRLGGRRVHDAYLEPNDAVTLGASTVAVHPTASSTTIDVGSCIQLGGLVGASPAMRRVYDRIKRLARSDEAVLITGETGTGKELAAEAIVNESARAGGPLVVVDCARPDTELFEAELFGHTRGAFTGAVADVPGAFERAHGGTVLLDQVCDLPLSMQPKLLGVLERRSLQRLGGGVATSVDVRVIATSRRPLEREVNKGGFRADLYYRLAVLQLDLPPLREHPEDIPNLVSHFRKDLPAAGALSPAMLEQLYSADYPGNVRELRNAVARASLGLGTAAAAPARVTDLTLDEPFYAQRERALVALERRYLDVLLVACQGNMSEAARRSGISRVQLYAMLQRCGLPPPRKR